MNRLERMHLIDLIEKHKNAHICSALNLPNKSHISFSATVTHISYDETAITLSYIGGTVGDDDFIEVFIGDETTFTKELNEQDRCIRYTIENQVNIIIELDTPPTDIKIIDRSSDINV